MSKKHAPSSAPSAIPSWLWTEASHDLRQPLQSLELIASTLPGSSAEEIERSARTIVRLSQSTGQMHAFLAGFAALAERHEAGNAVLTTIALDEVCQAAIGQVAPLGQVRGIDISATLAVAAVAGDRDWVRDTIAGLLLNAIKLSRGTDIEVTLASRRGRGQAQGSMRLDVVFEAALISPRQLRAAFVDVSWPDRPGAWQLGLGLGSICHVAQLLGGGFEHRSLANSRQKFTLLFGGGLDRR